MDTKYTSIFDEYDFTSYVSSMLPQDRVGFNISEAAAGLKRFAESCYKGQNLDRSFMALYSDVEPGLRKDGKLIACRCLGGYTYENIEFPIYVEMDITNSDRLWTLYYKKDDKFIPFFKN